MNATEGKMKKQPELFEEEVDLILLTTILPDWYLVEIGRVVANFALLENELSSLIHCLLGTNEDITRIITSELSFRNLIDMSASLVIQTQTPKDVEKYKATLKLVGDVEVKRNNIVHSLWGAGFTRVATRTKHIAKRARGLQIKREEYTLEDLQSVAIQIVRTVHAVKVFKESLGCVHRLS